MSWFRHPRTTRARRYLARKWRSLPTTWSDLFRRPQRSWKAHRGRQWKARENSAE